MKKMFAVLLILIQFILLTIAFESKAAPLCQTVLQTEQLQQLFSELQDTATSKLHNIELRSYQLQDLPEHLHIDFIQQNQFPNYHMIRKNGPYWGSRHFLAAFAPIGNITYMTQIFGPKIGRMLGFHQIDQNTILIPRVDLMNKRIQTINRILEIKGLKPIEISFEEVPADSAFSVKKFLQMFDQKSALPVAASGSFALHDLSYHFAEIGLPHTLVKYVKDRARLVMMIDHFIQLRGTDSDKNIWKKIRQYEASSIDVLANIGMIYLKIPGYQRSYIEAQFNNGSSPLHLLLYIMKNRGISPETVENFLANTPTEQLQQFRRTLADRMGIQINKNDPSGKTYKDILYDHIEKSMIDRINEIKSSLENI